MHLCLAEGTGRGTGGDGAGDGLHEAKPEPCDCSSPQPAAARDGSCSSARSLQDKHRLKDRNSLLVHEETQSTGCILTSLPFPLVVSCWHLLSARSSRAFRSPRGCAQHGAFRKTHLQETAGDGEQKTAGMQHGPPRKGARREL